MVALVVGAIAITSVYAVGAASSQQFREQQRLSGLQSSLRMAVNQLKRDIGRIGYHATPNINRAGEKCMDTNLVVPIALTEDAPLDLALVDTDDFTNVLHADQITLMGNYATRSEYLLDGLANMGTTQAAFLQTEWQAFRRDFVKRADWGQPFTMNMLNAGAFESAFRADRWMRLQNRDGFKFFVTITGTASDQGRPQINFMINPALPLGSACVGGNMSGGKAAPLSAIRYRLLDGTNDAAGTWQDNAVLNGANIQLVREELRPGTNQLLSAGDAELTNSSRRVLLDYVVNFNIRAVIDANAGVAGLPPCLWQYDNGANESPAGTCNIPANGNVFANMTNQVRSLIIDLSVRTPEPDMNFPWFGGPITRPPITRYRPKAFIDNNRTEAFRVRSLHTEIFLPNLI